MKLEGRVALVTGASKGIGRAIAIAFAREGARVVATGRDAADLESLAAQIAPTPGACATIVADLSDRAAVDEVHARTVAAFGDPHILVNNAGIGSSADPRPVVEYDDGFWERMLYVNLTVPYMLCKRVLPAMIARGHGRIVNVSSINGKIGALHGAAYAASKHGLLGLTRTLAMETTAQGITSNAICPGPVATQMHDRRLDYDTRRLGKTAEELQKSMTLLGRRLVPDEIAPLAVYLASDDSSGMTGQAINVDGGIVMTG